MFVFPCLEATEAAGYKGRIIEEKIWEALKKVGKDKIPGIQGLPYEVYLRLSPRFVPLLKILFKLWLKQGRRRSRADKIGSIQGL